MSNFTYSITPEELTFGKLGDKVGFSLHITANKKSNLPTLSVEVPYGNTTDKLIAGDISGIKIETPSNKWSVEKELIESDDIVLFTINCTRKLKNKEKLFIGFLNVPINGKEGTTTLKVFEGDSDDSILSQKIQKVENKTPSINVFRATLPFIFKRGDTKLYWNVTNGKNIALYRKYVNYTTRSITSIRDDSILIVDGLLENQSYEIKKLEKSAIFYLFARNDDARSPYASCNILVQEPLIISYKIKEGKEEEHIYGSPLVLSWNTQFSNPNNPKNKCWIVVKVYNNDGSVKETYKVENLPQEGTYTFYPTAPTDYALYIKEPDFNRIMQEISITVSPTTPIGAITMFAGRELPEGWMFCDGSEIKEAAFKERFKSKDEKLVAASYKELKLAIGHQLPDLRDRFIMGGSSNNVNDKGEGDKHRHTTLKSKKEYTLSANSGHRHKFPSAWYGRNLRGGEYTGIDIRGRDIDHETTSLNGYHRHTLEVNFEKFDTELNDTAGHPAWYQLAFITKVLF